MAKSDIHDLVHIAYLNPELNKFLISAHVTIRNNKYLTDQISLSVFHIFIFRINHF